VIDEHLPSDLRTAGNTLTDMYRNFPHGAPGIIAQDHKSTSQTEKSLNQYQSDFEGIARISSEQLQRVAKLKNHQEATYLSLDDQLILRTQDKLTLLIEYKLAELRKTNFGDLQYDKESIKFYDLIQIRMNQFIDGVMRDISDEIQKVQSRSIFIEFQSPLGGEIGAIHLYLATAIDFLYRNKMINTEVTRMFFQDDKSLFWIVNLNIYQLMYKFKISVTGGIADINNQWFWTLKWNFFKGTLLHELLSTEKIYKLIDQIISN
jgi:hypothetical protein